MQTSSFKSINQVVSLRQIVIVDGTSIRSGISEDAVQRYMLTYSPDSDSSYSSTTKQGKQQNINLEALPPLLLLLLQGTKPSEALYALIDGLHRREALSRLKSPKVSATIIYEPVFTLQDIDSSEVRRLIKFEGLRANWRHGLYLTKEQRRAVIEDLYFNEKLPMEQLAALGIPISTLYLWFSETERRKKDDLRDRAVQMSKEGLTALKIAESLIEEHPGMDISRRSVARWIEGPAPAEGSDTFGQNSSAGILAKSHSPSAPAVTPLNIDISAAQERAAARDLAHSAAAFPATDSDSEDIQSLEKIRDLFCDIAVTDKTDHYVAVEILNMLSASFPSVAAIIKDGGYSIKYEELSARYNDLLARHNKVVEEKIGIEEQLTALRHDYRERTERCSFRCVFIVPELAKKYDEFLDAALTDIQFLLEHDPLNSKFAERLGLKVLAAANWFVLNGAANQNVMNKIEQFEKLCQASRDLFSREIYKRLAKVKTSLQAVLDKSKEANYASSN